MKNLNKLKGKILPGFMLLTVFIFSFLGNIIPSFSQNQVIVRLKAPPVNQMTMKDIWSMTLRNTTRSDIKIYLEGNATEAKDGLLAEGKSKEFTLPPGEKTYGYDDFKNGSVSWKNRKYEDIFLRTGNAPSGDYTFCVTAYAAQGDVVGQENCIENNIEIVSQQEITLIQPVDGEKADPKTVTFMWTPITPAPKEGYGLKMVEMRGTQSAEDAMQHNTAFFSQGNIRTTSFQYPISGRKLEAGKKYAWQVSGASGNQAPTMSNVSYFVAGSGGCAGTLKIDSVRCNGTLNGKIVYRVCAKYTASNTNTCNILFNNPTNNTSNNFGMQQSGQSNIFCSRTIGTTTQNYSPLLNTLTSSMTPGTSVLFCFDLLVPPGTLGVKFTAFGYCDDNSGNYNTANANDTITLPVCFCDPCKDMKVKMAEDVLNPPNNGNPGEVDLSGVFANLDYNLIKKITAEIIYFDIKQTKDTACAKCVFDSKQFGNFTLPASAISNYTGPVLDQSGYSHLVTWTNKTEKDCSGATANTGGNTASPKFTLPISVPDASKLKCCADIIKICVRYTFYDYCCHACETIKCYEINRDNK
jgi:hypothetical protein